MSPAMLRPIPRIFIISENIKNQINLSQMANHLTGILLTSDEIIVGNDGIFRLIPKQNEEDEIG